MSTVKFVTAPSKRLAESITGASTTFKLNDIGGWDGVDLTSAFFGSRLWVVFRNSAGTLMEIMEIDPTTITAASSAITIITRGLKFNGDQSTSVAGNKLTWVKGDTIVELGTHVPQLLEEIVRTDGAQTINDVKTFVSSPVVPSPTNPTDAANKSYADAMAVAGGTDALPSAKGISKLTATPNYSLGTVTMTVASPCVVSLNAHGLIAGDTIKFTTTGSLPTGITASTTYYVISAGLTANAFEISASSGGSAINTTGSQSGVHTLFRTTPFAVGASDPQYIHYFADTGSANTYVITPNPAVAAYATGQRFSFKAVNANTTAATLNVNGLGAIAIKKLSATALVANDILAGAIVMVEYDGTNFQMISQIGNLAVFSSKISVVTADATWANSDANERTWFTVSIPANTLSTANAVKLTLSFSWANGTSSNTKRIKLKYGSTTIYDSTALTDAGSVTYRGLLTILLMGAGTTSSQEGSFHLQGLVTGKIGQDATNFLHVDGIGTAAEDSTTTLNLLVTIQDGGGDNQTLITADHMIVEVIK